MNQLILIRQLTDEDLPVIVNAFRLQGWDKSLDQFRNYLREQSAGKREILVAEFRNEFAGYLTIVLQSKYPPFEEKSTPEIVDLNVLMVFRNRGIGTALMDAAENLISGRSDIVGIGVGLTADYGAAQRLYIKRGYVPDGRGLFQRGNFPKYGDEITVDDDLALYLTKQVKRSL